MSRSSYLGVVGNPSNHDIYQSHSQASNYDLVITILHRPLHSPHNTLHLDYIIYQLFDSTPTHILHYTTLRHITPHYLSRQSFIHIR